MKIPYYKQETEWTCGAASMRMVLESFGIKRSEKQLIKLLKTNKVVGTWEFELPKLAERYKLDYVVERNGTVDDLREFVKEGFVIIVCYYIIQEREAHYAVLINIDDENVYLNDPWFGANHILQREYFEKVWKSDPKREGDRRWFIGIKK